MQTDDKEENFYFIKGISLSLIFFTITPLLIIISLFSLYSITKSSEKPQVLGEFAGRTIQAGVSVYASLPADATTVSTDIQAIDARTALLKTYLRSHYSPLEKYADFIVQEADINSLDYRLLVAIAQQESNLCKKIPPNSFNCWGWGIHSQGTLHFSSFEEGITEVSKGLKENYVDKGYTNIEDIMSKYTPLSQGSWASGVSKFMEDIETLSY